METGRFAPNAPRRLQFGAVELDTIDIRLLSILQDDGRISKLELAQRINLSTSACFERMKRLEVSRIIASYHARIDTALLFDIHHFRTLVVLRSHMAKDFEVFERYVRQARWITRCEALGGGMDYAMDVIGKNVRQYQDFIDDMLHADIGVEKYYTYIVTKLVKNVVPTLEQELHLLR